jgi:HEAT repeat protein
MRLVLVLACSVLPGCASFWDEVTSREFHLKDAFHKKPEPMWVLENSKDGDARRKALEALKEPLQIGGTQAEQDKVVAILCNAAVHEPPVCRLAAIKALRSFKDPRIVEPLIQAYYESTNFNPDTVVAIRTQALDALGAIRQPQAFPVLLRVVKQPPMQGAALDREMNTNERIIAARALANYPQLVSAQALVELLRKEQDPGLRNAATESLRAMSGKNYPADVQAWDDYMKRSSNDKDAFAHTPSPMDHFFRLVSGHSTP